MIIRGENSESLPVDLIIEILSRLPAKSVVRFRCVSKQWGSMLLCPYFTELFQTRSSARPPRLLFAVERSDYWCFLTSPQPHNPYEKSSLSLVVGTEFHMKFPGDNGLYLGGRVSGLKYSEILEEDRRTVICNPSTGQFMSLPLPKDGHRSFLGFDPIDKQIKVLSCSSLNTPDQIMTLGTGKDSWRKIHCPLNHLPGGGEGICINGVLYYIGIQIDIDLDLPFLIVCFDVRSENFKFIHRDFVMYQHDTELINYKGKLGVITMEYDLSGDYRPYRFRSVKLCMWVIKDVEKPEPEWSKYFSMCWDDDLVAELISLSIVGVTATGEIVLSTNDLNKKFYVFFINTERSTVQSVEIQGLGANHSDSRGRSEHRRVQIFVDHVEDLKFITTKTTRTEA